MGLVRFKINQQDVVEDEHRTLGEVLEAKGIGRENKAYLPNDPANEISPNTPVGQLEGRNVGVVEPSTLG